MSRRSLFTTLFLFVLLVAGLFVGRVFSYYQKIQSGSIALTDLPSYTFADKLTTSALAKSAAAAVPSAGTLATDDDPALGSVDAPLTLVEFGDFQCPYSAEESYLIRRLASQFGDSVRVIYRDFPLSDIHPEAALAAEAGGCASEQGAFWSYHDKLFANQSDLSRAALITYAGAVGMSTQKFESCLNSRRYKNEVAEDAAAGEAAGVYGTPTFFFNGQMVSGAVPEETLNQIIRLFTSGT